MSQYLSIVLVERLTVRQDVTNVYSICTIHTKYMLCLDGWTIHLKHHTLAYNLISYT